MIWQRASVPPPSSPPRARGIGSRIVQGLRPELVVGALHGHPQRGRLPARERQQRPLQLLASHRADELGPIVVRCVQRSPRQGRDALPGLERTLYPRRADLRTSEPVQRTAGSQRNTRDDRGRWLRSCRAQGGGAPTRHRPFVSQSPPDHYTRRVRRDSSSNARSAIGERDVGALCLRTRGVQPASSHASPCARRRRTRCPRDR